MLGARGEHAVGLIYTLCYQIIDEHANVGLIACQNKWFSPYNLLMGIHSGHQPLPCSFLVARGTIYLACKEETSHQLGFQCVAKLGRIKKVILDSITWAIDMCIGQSRNMTQRCNLHIPRQR